MTKQIVAIDDSEVALPLLTMMPCVDVGVPVWGSSLLDIAAHKDLVGGVVPISCKRFVAHRHSQFVLEACFSGDYPTSKARVPLDVNLLSVLAQTLIFFLPGVICELLPPSFYVYEEPATGGHFTYKMVPDRLEEEDEADEESALLRRESLDRSPGDDELIAARSSMPARVWRDLQSHRWKHYFLVPKGRAWHQYFLPEKIQEILSLTWLYRYV